MAEEPGLKKRLPIPLAELIVKMEETKTYLPIVKRLPQKFDDLVHRFNAFNQTLKNYLTLNLMKSEMENFKIEISHLLKNQELKQFDAL